MKGTTREMVWATLSSAGLNSFLTVRYVVAAAGAVVVDKRARFALRQVFGCNSDEMEALTH
jgi:hypothetical protein